LGPRRLPALHLPDEEIPALRRIHHRTAIAHPLREGGHPSAIGFPCPRLKAPSRTRPPNRVPCPRFKIPHDSRSPRFKIPIQDPRQKVEKPLANGFDESRRGREQQAVVGPVEGFR
jgi:hypothetical protein